MLFIQGSRDPDYCDLPELQSALDSAGPKATLYLIPDADHAFQLPPTAPQPHQDPILQATTATATWIHHQLKPPTT